ncbi:isoprenoid synthase domain-containing protein [Cyathus striatus]|nr:isoprenoid synthase domain-containing protein [Cyathus striatus]
MSNTIYIPNNLRSRPWQRFAESQAWAEIFGAFSPKAQKAFNECDYSLLASMAYATLDKDGCRVAWVLEWSDVADPHEAQKFADIIMDAIKHLHVPCPQGEWVAGELARQYWANAIRTATPSSQRRFVKEFKNYTDSVNHIRTIREYFDARRIIIGAKPSFAIDEMQARGDELHNLVTVVMHQLKLNVQEPIDWIAELSDNITNKFLDDYRKVPSWGPEIDEDVQKYVDALGNWVRANTQWCFESHRHFGKDGLYIMREITIELLPRNELKAIKPDMQDNVDLF